MNSLEYLEMSGCEQLLSRIGLDGLETPWDDNSEENLKIVREYLDFRYQQLKRKV